MTMIESLWLLPLGVAAGTVGSIIGIGGGIIAVPAMMFAGFSPPLAASNSLFLVLGNSISSSSEYSSQKRIEYRTGLRLGLCCVPGTILGAVLVAQAPPEIFKVLFAGVMIISGLYLFANRKMLEGRGALHAAVAALSAAVAFFAGMLSSFFGIGAGIVFVPLMAVLLGMRMRRAAPTSQFVLLFASASGIAAHALLGHPDVVHAAYLFAGGMIGGIVGARVSVLLREKYLRLLVLASMLVVSVRLVWDAVAG